MRLAGWVAGTKSVSLEGKERRDEGWKGMVEKVGKEEGEGEETLLLKSERNVRRRPQRATMLTEF